MRRRSNDEALSLLARRGYPIPVDVLARDPHRAYDDADERVIEAWRQVYVDETADGRELAELGEALIEVAAWHTRWRSCTTTAVRRILGAKPGTGGSAGLSWLKHAADTAVFPELWDVRGVL